MQASGKMMDMLLGVAEPTQIGQPNLQMGEAASGSLFGDILGLLTVTPGLVLPQAITPQSCGLFCAAWQRPSITF